jgi:hypothetical protein
MGLDQLIAKGIVKWLPDIWSAGMLHLDLVL